MSIANNLQHDIFPASEAPHAPNRLLQGEPWVCAMPAVPRHYIIPTLQSHKDSLHTLDTENQSKF